ncbi:uncharacterized protein LOC126163165 [Schistocerca cancellata]|uniref:uncharacterized protein LOC126163165 n=1 Tax=Schistocerca cancellata TaxID=274614 RepID=UPI00211863A2|nr:uncharacterized protein LOC126163165 [Schistocerca cancellata]
MHVEWKYWCRLCASADGNATVVFKSKDRLLPDKIFKYLSILIENQDVLPQSVCESCVKKIGSFDRYADQCLRVQSMFKTMIEETDGADAKAGFVSQESPNETQAVLPSHELQESDSKENIAVENNQQLPVENSTEVLPKKPKSKPLRKKNANKAPLLTTAHSKKNTKHTKRKGENDFQRRVSIRLKNVTQAQNEFSTVSDVEVKEEDRPPDEAKKDVITVPKKRSRSGKTLVGAAKRKAKVPRVVKPECAKLLEEKAPGTKDTIPSNPSSTEMITEPVKVEETDAPEENSCPGTPSAEQEDRSEVDKPDTSFDAFDDRPDDDSSDDDRDDKTDKEKTDQEKTPTFRWECHVCHEVLANWNSLAVHCRQVHDVQAQVICICSQVLSNRGSIIKHRQLHTDSFQYRCDKCDKAFSRKSLYDLHVLSHVPKEQQPFVCCKCARRFHCEALLRHHERVHLPREERLIYPCSVCNKKFSSRSNVSSHLKAVHFGERPFVCEQCGHSFTSKGILQEHLTIHSDETPFRCTKCKKSFKTKYRLKIHMDTHRETPYQCPMCPHQLSTRRTLRTHLLIHKDIRAYQCATCGKAFRRPKDLKNHHNLHTGLRPYTCMFCPRTFANGSNCRAHKRKMHPEELRVYEESLAAAAAAAEDDGSGTSEATTQTPGATTPAPPTLISSESAMVNSETLSGLNANPVLQNSSSGRPQAGNIIVSVPSSEYGRPAVFETNAIVSSCVKPSTVNSVPHLLPHQSVIPASNSDYGISSTGMSNAGHVTVGPVISHTDHSVNTITPMMALSAASMVRVNDSCRNPNQIPRNEHMSAVEDGSADRNMSTVNPNLTRRGMTAVDILNSHGLATITPLNLNVSEVHASRSQHIPESPSVTDEEASYLTGTRRTDSFANSRHHLQNLNPNIQIHHQEQHHSMGHVGRALPEPAALSRMQHTQHPGAVSMDSVAPLQVQGYSTLNHLYHHGDAMPSAVAAAIAHSGTVAVPAFPGNPYVHHNIGYARSGNM